MQPGVEGTDVPDFYVSHNLVIMCRQLFVVPVNCKQLICKQSTNYLQMECVRSGDGVLNESTRKNTILLYFSWL